MSTARVRGPSLAVAVSGLTRAANVGDGESRHQLGKLGRPGFGVRPGIPAESGFVGVQLRVNDEQGEWVGSAGVREPGQSAKPLTNGHFRIGSSAKSFVATSVLMLVAEGRIDLDAPADACLPELGLDRRITVRMLLQHTSGIFNHTGELYEDGTIVLGVPWQGKKWVDNRFKTYLPEELVRLSLSRPARFAPGEGWSSANTNYVLARLVVEKVTGRAFADELQRLILGPLGMTGTVAPGASPEIPEPHNHSYYRYEDASQERTVAHPRPRVQLGSMRSRMPVGGSWTPSPPCGREYLLSNRRAPPEPAPDRHRSRTGRCVPSLEDAQPTPGQPPARVRQGHSYLACPRTRRLTPATAQAAHADGGSAPGPRSPTKYPPATRRPSARTAGPGQPGR
ncbi:serine hydrolase [Streptomyces sp. NPDC059456]|uniref:serine hydrolase n=1 Tax=Streptomyces sp. NPDC059456 TaxID=3346838 RepID=UPI003680927B